MSTHCVYDTRLFGPTGINLLVIFSSTAGLSCAILVLLLQVYRMFTNYVCMVMCAWLVRHLRFQQQPTQRRLIKFIVSTFLVCIPCTVIFVAAINIIIGIFIRFFETYRSNYITCVYCCVIHSIGCVFYVRGFLIRCALTTIAKSMSRHKTHTRKLVKGIHTDNKHKYVHKHIRQHSHQFPRAGHEHTKTACPTYAYAA